MYLTTRDMRNFPRSKLRHLRERFPPLKMNIVSLSSSSLTDFRNNSKIKSSKVKKRKKKSREGIDGCRRKQKKLEEKESS